MKQATRVTSTSESIIDLIFVSDPNKICQSGTITVGLSDHYMTYCTRKTTKVQNNKHKTIKIRSMKKYTTESFHEKLKAVNWSEIFNTENIDSAWNCFKQLFRSVIDDIAPFKEIRVKQRSEPWFDTELRDLIQKRDKALSDFNKNKDPCLYYYYKKLRNKVQYEIKKSKSIYYKQKVEENIKNPKKLWGFLKDLGAGEKCSTKSIV